jgi:hypothetical protein
MRRFFVTLTALGLLGGLVGCHHVAGVCDCDVGHNVYGPAYSAHDFESAPVAHDMPVGGHIHAATNNEPPMTTQTVAFSE